MNSDSRRRGVNRRPWSATVIVPFHNNLDYLARCLEALASRPPGVDVIVASDGARSVANWSPALGRARLPTANPTRAGSGANRAAHRPRRDSDLR
jgi:hypothetical protein